MGDFPIINRGLAAHEPDHYAILGVPLTAEAKEISDRYKQVAKALRVGFVGNTSEAKLAQDIFAKLVGPAKDILTKDRDKIEYDAVLQLRARRLLDNPPEGLWPMSDAVASFRHSATWETDYQNAVAAVAGLQYSELDQIGDRIEQISELNLAYLLLKSGGSSTKPQPAPAAASAPVPVQAAVQTPAPAPTPVPSRRSVTDAETRFNQALTMIENKQYDAAIQFLTVAIEQDPGDARFYVQRGIAHLRKRNSRARARIDFQKAAQLEPSNEEAKKYLKRMAQEDAPTKGAPSSPAKTTSSTPNSKKGDTSGGGLFGRLFKKKS